MAKSTLDNEPGVQQINRQLVECKARQTSVQS